MNYIQGIVKIILFHSEENSFTILKVEVTATNENLGLFHYDDTDLITVTGYFPKPMRKEEIKFFGTFKEHTKYGMQYVVKSFEKISDTSVPGLIEYLSSDLFKGVGIKTATQIVETLGTNAIDRILEDKEVLNTFTKISDKVKDILFDGLQNNKKSEQVLIKLYSYEISPKMAIKIYNQYQNETIAIIEQNPFQLMYDVEGIGFERADSIRSKIGMSEDNPLRIKAMIIYLYQLMGQNYGHTYLEREQLIEYMMNTLQKSQTQISFEDLNQYLNELIAERFFREEENKIKLSSVHYAEQHIVSKIKEYAQMELNETSTKQVDDYIVLFEKIHDIEYTKKQKQAIHKALESNIFILTGGPGTGKTTVIKGIVFVYCKIHQIPLLEKDPLFSVKLIAPTGKAAKRMNESTNIYAETIHRFLGYNFEGTFMFDEDNLVPADVVIVDESSMIDVFLMSHLLRALSPKTKLIIVGDEDQLPSVGVGQILKDLIDSDVIDYVALHTIHRQARDSHIIQLAHQINQNELPEDLNKAYDDRYFVEENIGSFQNRLKTIIEYLLNQGYDLHSDIQILIPMYRGSAGIDSVNQYIQNVFNLNKAKGIEYGDVSYYIGDKVIQLVNQAEDNIMNGDQGIVIGITEEDQLVVDFDGIEVFYKKGDLINLKHAYAMSIHKSQGSEYKVVILPIFKQYTAMLKKKLLYTAITRSKELLILIGNQETFLQGLTRNDFGRLSSLKDLIIHAVLNNASTVKETRYNHHYFKINDSTIPFDYLIEEMDESISPYSFKEEE